MSRAEAAKWFGDVVPELAKLLLRLPSLLESHYVNAQQGTALQLLESQDAGIVLLSQVSGVILYVSSDLILMIGHLVIVLFLIATRVDTIHP